MKTIAAVLQQAQSILIKSPSAQLDAEILLAKVMQVSRTQLFTWPEKKLTAPQLTAFAKLLKRRRHNYPIAYLVGEREFWSLSLQVNQHTLIPRTETELLVETVLQQLSPQQACHVADLGTGSGAIALALASERAHWSVYATDRSEDALQVAKQNAKRLGINNVQFSLGNWCHALPAGKRLHAIISNPPYIPAGDRHLQQGDLLFEPQQALQAGEDGLDCIKQIISQAKAHLLPDGLLIFEHGYDQAAAVSDLLKQAEFTSVQSKRDYSGVDRITFARNC